MRRIFTWIVLAVLPVIARAQTPVPMAAQPMLTYFEQFDSIISWTNNFASGYGANRFASVAPGGTNAIPDPTRITTSTATWTIGSTAGLQRDTINSRLLMVVSGTTNNTTSVAFDFFMDFTGKNAGTLSFDWETVFNGATNSNRNATLKVYASPNGSSFTELTAASVTITNNVAGNGTVANVALPASFSNNANTRLRFYFYNSAGGSTGSRPIIALDNIKVTAAGVPCTTPAGVASSLAFSNVTPTSIQGSFSAASPVPDEYLVIVTSLGGLTANPVDSTVYNPGDIVGDGTVIYRGSGTSFVANNLSPQTTYTFYIFSSSIYCNGAVKYNTNPLSGAQTTPAGPPCVAPTTQPGNLSFSAVTTNSLTGHFSAAMDASEYLVVASTASTLNATPVDGTVYNASDIIGNGFVVYRGADTSFLASGLNHSTNYYFFVFSLNNYACSNGPAYLVNTPLTGQQSTAQIFNCVTPHGAATNLTLNAQKNSIHGFFHPFLFPFDGYLVVMSTSNTLTALPQNQTVYTTGNTIGNGTVISTGKNYSFSAMNLAVSTTYHFFIFSYNDVCIGGPLYRTTTYLSGSAATTGTPPYNFYFGNLHAHSSYSDGNKDNPGFTPVDDYSYADNALCMDFLGISEHNHYTQSDNPGMLLQYYQQGLTQAAGYTAANPGFLALYGMEWGTTNSGGGHVLVYGVDSLVGWEKLSGIPNYDIFVPKNDFLSDTGLFRKVIQFSGNNAFATLAHPAFSDFQDMANQPYSGRADSAITGIALESGPAFSTNTTYTEPGSNMAFLPYYLHMLAKGYRVAPMIDHDNHNTTFGKTAYTRTGVIAPSLSKTDFMQAVRNMRVYATQDCDTKAEILVYNQQMGSELTHSFAPAFTIYALDSTSPTVVPSIKLMAGRPGSGVAPVVLHTANDYVMNFTDLSLPDSATAYYYADIFIGNKRTITAPVWYTRIDTGNIIINNLEEKSLSQEYSVLIRNNPAYTELQLQVVAGRPTPVQLTIYSMTGQRMINLDAGVIQGIRNLEIPLGMLPPGVYLLETMFGAQRMVKKFVH
jgi:trimeric autotransporter adhesin